MKCVYKTSIITVLKTCSFIKKKLQRSCFSVNIPKVLVTSFLLSNSSDCFKLSFSIRKEFKKKKVSGEIVLALKRFSVCFNLFVLLAMLWLFRLAWSESQLKKGHIPQEHLSFLQNLLNSIRNKKSMTT